MGFGGADVFPLEASNMWDPCPSLFTAASQMQDGEGKAKITSQNEFVPFWGWSKGRVQILSVI